MSKVYALVGPTAAEKSRLALEAAERLGAEIVAVDAFTVYRGLDVGTAKPSRVDRARVAHHLVDALEPEQPCTVSWFQTAARAAIEDIRARGHAPFLVGGSGLYFRAVVDDLAFPPTDEEVRARVERRFGGDARAAHAELTRVDPDAAERIDPANLRRSVRALEVAELTGRRFSDWRRAWDTHESVYAELRVVGLQTSRDELVERIDARVEQMLAAGLVEECRALRHRDLAPQAAGAIGYAEVFSYLDGVVDLDEAAERIRVRTRRYAARQQRWFRADPRVRWLSPDQLVEGLDR
ncbi:MAG: tRNA (adenosine(37)-N6)-dimethylallyltransferase MiaA [Egibacteraceae bacterium]